jgi:hypothetical protein
MEVLQIIQGREAVPVRAIPFLTGWEEMPPDKVAEALAGINHYGHFEGFTAYKLRTDGSIKKTFSQEWRIVVADLAGISATLNDTQTSVGAGRDLWRKQSISTLPAGVFVWRDELAKQYASSVRRTNYCKSGIDGETSWLKPPEMEFDIEVSSKWASLVLEGFAPANVTPQVQQSNKNAPVSEFTPAQTAAVAESVVGDSTRDKPGSRKVWTPEKLAELAAHRQRHKMAETVAKFGISEQRIRKLLQNAKPKASPFPGVIHRLK